MERKGRPLSAFDMMIAAHALAVGAVLVTNDSSFVAVDGLALEDWTEVRRQKAEGRSAMLGT